MNPDPKPDAPAAEPCFDEHGVGWCPGSDCASYRPHGWPGDKRFGGWACYHRTGNPLGFICIPWVLKILADHAAIDTLRQSKCDGHTGVEDYPTDPGEPQMWVAELDGHVGLPKPDPRDAINDAAGKGVMVRYGHET